MSWFDDLEANIEWVDGNTVAFQFDGNDLIHIDEIDPDTGMAVIRVFANTARNSCVIYTGVVNLKAHTTIDGE